MKTMARRIWDWINYNHPRQLGAALTTVIVLAGIVIGVHKLASCRHSIYRKMTGVTECITVTDGSFSFTDTLSGVEGKIHDLNKKVEKGSYVTVAYMGPLSNGDSLAQKRVRAILEGVYIGQLDAYNSGSRKSGTRIRLVLANDGSDTSHWVPIVKKLESMRNGKNPLVAVVGMQVSTVGTRKAARHLSSNDIPVVGDVISADGLVDRRGITNLWRVSPPNDSEVRALREFEYSQLQSARLVYNGDINDLYTDTLAADFKHYFGPKIQSSKRYDGMDPRGVGGQFKLITDSLCDKNTPDTVLYAGRVDLLPDFIDKLAALDCPKPVTVLTGDDGTSLPLSDKVKKVADNPQNTGTINVIYTSVAGTAGNPPLSPMFKAFIKKFTDKKLGFEPKDLQDETPAMAYDAITSVSTAINIASSLSPSSVSGILGNMTDPGRVHGATGTFGFDDFGNPRCRSLLLLQLTIQGGRVDDRYRNTWPPTPAAGCQGG